MVVRVVVCVVFVFEDGSAILRILAENGGHRKNPTAGRPQAQATKPAFGIGLFGRAPATLPVQGPMHQPHIGPTALQLAFDTHEHLMALGPAAYAAPATSRLSS